MRGKFEWLSHASGFGGDAALYVALLYQRVAVGDLPFAQPFETILFPIGHISLLYVYNILQEKSGNASHE